MVRTTFKKLFATYGKGPWRILSVFVLVLILEVPIVAHAGATDALFNFVGCVGSPITCAFSGIGYAIYELIGVFLSITAFLFNIIISETVFGFAAFLGKNGGIYAGWGVLRDVANIGLIFGFVFMGVATILDIHGYEVKKTLPRLIIFAVLLNFSLLASQAIIDVSNVLSAALYSQSINQDGSGCLKKSFLDTSCAANPNYGVAGMIMGDSKVNTVIHPGFKYDFGLTGYLGLSVVELVLMMVLIAMAIMLMTRAVVLVFLMVLSPIGFAGLAVPFLEGYAKKWWDTLLAQSFFAPVLLLLVFVGLKIGEGVAASNPDLFSAPLTDMFNPSGPGTFSTLFLFALVIGFLITALTVAKEMGAYGAAFATNIATKAVSYPFAVLGRETVGRGAAALRKAYNVKAGQRAQKHALWKPTTLGGKVGKWAVGFAGTAVDDGINSGLKGASGAKIGGFQSHDDREKELKERGKELHLALEGQDLKDALDKAQSGNPADKEEAEGRAREMNLHGLEEAIKTMSDEQVKKLGEVLSPEKFAKLMDSKEVPEDVQHKMGTARFARYDESNAKDLTTKDLVQLAKADNEKFKRIIQHDTTEFKSALKETQLEALDKSDDLSDSLRKMARQNTPAGRIERGHPESLQIWNNMNAETKMKVEAEVIVKNKQLLKAFDASAIQAALTKNKFNPKQLEQLRTELLTTTGKQREDIEAYFAKNPFSAGQMNWKVKAPPAAPAGGGTQSSNANNYRSAGGAAGDNTRNRGRRI